MIRSFGDLVAALLICAMAFMLVFQGLRTIGNMEIGIEQAERME